MLPAKQRACSGSKQTSPLVKMLMVPQPSPDSPQMVSPESSSISKILSITVLFGMLGKYLSHPFAIQHLLRDKFHRPDRRYREPAFRRRPSKFSFRQRRSYTMRIFHCAHICTRRDSFYYIVCCTGYSFFSYLGRESKDSVFTYWVISPMDFRRKNLYSP